MGADTTESTHASAPVPHIIAPQTFLSFVAKRAHRLLAIALHVKNRGEGKLILTRPLLGSLLDEASMMEEILDAYGARNNKAWYAFRRRVACCKLFANTGYKLLHIEHSTPAYNLLPVARNFETATEGALDFVSDVIKRVCTEMLKAADDLCLPMPEDVPGFSAYAEVLPTGRLPHDRKRRRIQSTAETIARVATAYLNLAAESQALYTAARVRREEYPACIPDPVSEEELRLLEYKFHSLQSLYDTNIADTDTESSDPDLRVLRGHVSVIYHLLEAAVGFCHYYERHLCSFSSEDSQYLSWMVSSENLLDALMAYCLAFAGHYLEAGRGLCQTMLKHYAEMGRITVPVPRYRGFHVRPSTLVAKIARHYGSDLTMELDGETYDASSPLDLFRANEQINAKKRRRLAHEIAHMTDAEQQVLVSDVELTRAVRRIVLTMAEKNKLVIYERPLPVEEEHFGEDKTLSQLALDEITRLLAMGKIDIEADIDATFIGDKRVLRDIQLLAENGYGEDNFGNNVPLPAALSYLRR